MFYNHQEIEKKWQQYWKDNETFKSHQPTANSQQHIALLLCQIEKGGVTSVVKNTLLRLHHLKIRTTIFSLKEAAEDTLSNDYLQELNAELIILPESIELASNTLVSYIQKENIPIVIGVGLWDILPIMSAVKAHTPAKIANWYHTMPFYTEQIDRNEARKSLIGCLTYYCLKLPLIHRLGIRNALRKRHQIFLSLYDYYIMLCPEYCKELISRLKLQGDKAKKVISLINTIELNPSSTLQKQKEIAYLGRYHEEKQVIDLLKVWQRIHHEIPDWTLKLYGTGDEEQILKDFVSKHQLPRVDFMGYTSDVQAVYDRTAIVCLTSIYEGWGMVLTEAQNNGVIPVSYQCSDGVVSVIGEDERAGRLVPYGDIASYGRTLVELATNEPLRQQLQKACLEKRLDYVPEINDDTWHKLLEIN